MKIIKSLILLSLSIFLTLVVFYNVDNSKLITKIGGFSILYISSGSMEPVLTMGDIIIIKECENYEINDIITYNVNNQYLVTHRIIERDGNNYTTKGDNNNTIDSEKVKLENIEGKVILNSKVLKTFYKYWFVIVLVVLLILIIL